MKLNVRQMKSPEEKQKILKGQINGASEFGRQYMMHQIVSPRKGKTQEHSVLQWLQKLSATEIVDNNNECSNCVNFATLEQIQSESIFLPLPTRYLEFLKKIQNRIYRNLMLEKLKPKFEKEKLYLVQYSSSKHFSLCCKVQGVGNCIQTSKLFYSLPASQQIVTRISVQQCYT